ncbi:hypothetical protein EW146_g6372 [Bondarzewia mesenterica]|uniref:Uncharacterized protein n=1 Tax=Bondarzewia mesenterica TaxID=1095465 RepID=A0A4S4LNX9_9AGAM|nr:hypothetical protein EW146_g6372 [Bondarzewia mesenterica]
MYFDLNVPIPQPSHSAHPSQSKKGKGKQQQQQASSSPSPSPPLFSPAQIAALEARLDLLVHLGYTVLALTQTVHKKVDPKTFVNALDPLLGQLRAREGIVYLKRLTIVLDEDSEKGFGLVRLSPSPPPPYSLTRAKNK